MIKDEILRSWVSGLKCAKFPSLLRKIACEIGVDIELTIEKHILRETVFFKIEDKKEKLNQFMSILEESIKDYNER